jgi:hypothetical protein
MLRVKSEVFDVMTVGNWDWMPGYIERPLDICGKLFGKRLLSNFRISAIMTIIILQLNLDTEVHTLLLLDQTPTSNPKQAPRFRT